MDDRQSSSPGGGGQAPGADALLAAIARAVRHRREQAPAPFWAILEHLAVPRRSAAARELRMQLTTLQRGGLVQRVSQHGIPAWTPTPAGRRRLARLRRAGAAPSLPESPQHLAWRHARATAGLELERFRVALTATLEQAHAMVGAAVPGEANAPSSDAWLLLGRRLAWECRRLGSAWHCAFEWPEPEEERADFDELGPARGPGEQDETPAAGMRMRALRAGRRNVRLWEDLDPLKD
jgi:hypothetical protein